MAQKYSSSSGRHAAPEKKQIEFIFGKSNYRLMLISIAVVILGFILMTGTSDIYDFRKIVLAPFVVLVGFGISFFAILKTPKRSE